MLDFPSMLLFDPPATHSPEAVSKKPWAYFLLNLLLAAEWPLVLVRHPSEWPTVLGAEVLLSLGVLQHGSRIFLPLSAVRRTESLSTTHKTQLRTLGRVSFLLGILCVVLAVLGVVFEFHRPLVLQIVAFIFLILIPNSLLDLIGEGGKPMSALQASSQQIVLEGSERLRSDHWGEQML